MRVCDVHAHVYPDKIADRAAQSIGHFYHVRMEETDGSIGRLMREMESAGIQRSVVHSVAVRPDTVESINTFIADSVRTHPQLVGFMTMHQDYADPAAEIERAMGLGLKGIKLHPDTQAVDMDDPRLMKVYEIAEEKGLPLVIHCGDYRYDWSHPRRLKHILHEFPRLVADGAHFGGWMLYDYALEFLEDERCFVDVSSAMLYLGPRRTRELVEHYGYDRVLFGSDFPMWSPSGVLDVFMSLGFSQAAYEKMCWYNAERFLGMDLS